MALFTAIEDRNYDEAKALIASKADLNFRGVYEHPYTPLIYACRCKSTEIALMLIAAGADLNIQDNENTALIYACSNKSTEVALALIAAKANLSIQDNRGNTALSYACRRESTEVVLALISAGADLNVRDKQRRTALINANSMDKSTSMALTLIAARADLNIQDNRGNTALIYACGNGLAEVALALIAAKADLNIRNNDGNTALMCSCAGNCNEVPMALIAAGADINIKNNDDITVLTYAMIKLPKVALTLIKSDDLVYHSKYAKMSVNDMQKALSFKFSEYPVSHKFTLADTHLLNARNFNRVKTLMLVRNRTNNYLHILPMELMELLFANLFN